MCRQSPKHRSQNIRFLNTMNAAIYVRVSTDKQTHDSQLCELHEYCRRRNWNNVAEYCDTISGASFSRDGLNRMMGDVRRGKLDAIVCFNSIGLAEACHTWHKSSANLQATRLRWFARVKVSTPAD